MSDYKEGSEAAAIAEVAEAVVKGLREIGIGGLQPGTLEFIGMQLRDQVPEIAMALNSIASALESIAEAIREKGS